MTRALLCAAAWAAASAAGPPARADVVEHPAAGGARVTVDWSQGELTARAVAPADRHAPSPAVARDAARVRAEDAAREALTAAARGLRRAGGPAPAGDALARAARRATEVGFDLGTDGSATVELALPIEAVRVAAAGPRPVTPAAPAAAPPPTVIVDARHVRVRPSVGLQLAAGGQTWSGPVLWVDRIPPAGDPRVGDHPVRVRARKAARPGGVETLEVAGDLPGAGALAVVVIGEKP